MNWLDYLLVFIFLFNLYNGFRFGFLRQFFGLFSTLAALYAAIFWHEMIRAYLQKFLKLEEIMVVLAPKGGESAWLVAILVKIFAFLLVFFLISVLLALLSRKLRFLHKVPLIGPLNALVGGIFGALKGLVLIFLIVALLSLIETDFWVKAIDASAVVSLSRHYLPLLSSLIYDLVVNKLSQFI